MTINVSNRSLLAKSGSEVCPFAERLGRGGDGGAAAAGSVRGRRHCHRRALGMCASSGEHAAHPDHAPRRHASAIPLPQGLLPESGTLPQKISRVSGILLQGVPCRAVLPRTLPRPVRRRTHSLAPLNLFHSSRPPPSTYPNVNPLSQECRWVCVQTPTCLVLSSRLCLFTLTPHP